ncbi:MAG TPA: NUDIX domain-containing protein [Caldithrix sp.]|nr:NUDIX domain-containing protein [Caldithrix sp.]
MKVKIIESKRVLDDFFQVDDVIVQHEKFSGLLSQPMRRLNLERGEAVAVLIYLQDKDAFILVRQFRYAVHISSDSGWIDEIAAGVLEDDNPLACAKRECIEETGYEINKFEKIGFIYPTPGITSERIHLYIGYCNSHDKKHKGGGLDTEHEDIKIIEIPKIQAYKKAAQGKFKDGKTILAIQHFQLKENGLI